MAEVIGWGSNEASTTSLSVTVPEGVQENDLLYAWVTSNAELAGEVVPTGWTLVPEGTIVEGDIGTGTAVQLYERVADEDDESEPTYNWTWTTAHNRSIILAAIRAPEGVREISVAGAEGVDVVPAPSLDAQEGDLLLLYGFNWSGTGGSNPSFVGLTSEVDQLRTCSAVVDIIDSGPTEEYDCSSSVVGRMAACVVLFEGSDEPEPPEPEVIWQNTFDGASGAITTANSGNYGDALSAVAGTAVYQTAQRMHGAGAAQLGTVSALGEVGIVFSEGTSSPWSIRFYFRMPDNCVFVLGTSPAGESGAGTPISLSSSPTYTSTLLNGSVAPEVVAEMVGNWVRAEIIYPGFGIGVAQARLWWTDPESTDEPDLERTGFNYLTGALYIRSGQASAFGASQVDSVALGEGQWIGPYEPGTDVVVENTLDGPTGVEVTTGNSGDYGTPVTSVGQAPEYSDEWVAAGTSSVELQTTNPLGSSISWALSPNLSQYAIRFYALVPAGGWFSNQLGLSASFGINDNAGSYTWSGVDLSSISSDIVDQPIRVEILANDYTAELRIWWTDIHGSLDEWDYSINTSTEAWSVATACTFIGASGPSTVAVYVDEVVLREAGAGWIGPATEAGQGFGEAYVTFGGTAEGTVDIAGFVEADIDFSGEAEGVKNATSGSVEHSVAYSTELEYDARELGLAIHDVEYSGEAAGVAERDTDAAATVEYSGDIEWFTERDSEGAADVVYLPEAQGESRVTLPDVTRVGLRYRLVTYDPNGDVRGQIPLPLSFQMGVPLNDLPSLALEYLRSAPGAEALNDHCEVAVELATLISPAYVEYPGCRFINLRNQSDPSDRTGNVKYTMPHYGWQLRKARVLTGLDEEGQRSFANATFGSIMHTLLTEAQGRGWNTGMSWDFTPQRDSAGQVWENVYTVSFDAGQDLWTILDTFAQQAACDFRFHRRTLQVYNADTTLNRDRTNQAVLHLGRDITSAPNDWTSEELAARVLVRGDEGSSVMLTVPDAAEPWGTWETYVNQSGVTDTGTLTTLARWTLQKARVPLVQMTRGILFPTAEYMPFRDYQPGDFVTAPGSADQPWGANDQSDLRVRQITLASVTGQGMEGALVLNERFIESSLRRDRLLNALTGGAGSNPGGGGGGTPPREDTRTPRAPTGLVVASETYINEIGEPRGQITATWELVDEATNGTEMDIRSYEVWTRWAAANQTWMLQTSVSDPDNVAFMSPFNPDEVYEVRVRAIGRNMRASAFSTIVPILVEGDAEPPEIPAAPVLESRLGVVRATWNGLDFQGLPMAPDFDYVAVWMSETASEDDGWERIDTLYRTGVSVIPDLPYDTEFYFRFTALDRSGNESEPSSINSISVQQLVSGDITPGSIGYELLAEGAVRDDILADDAVRNRHIAAGEITGEKIRAYSIFADRIAVGNTRNLLTDPKHLDEDLNDLRLDLAEGEWSYTSSTPHAQEMPTLSRADNPNGTYRYFWIQSIEADSISDLNAGYRVQAELGRAVSSTLVTVTGRTAGVVAVTGFVRLLNREGGLVGQPGTTTEVNLNSNVTDFELISSNGAEIPPAAVSAVFYVRVVMTGVNAEASVSFARPFSALNDGQVLIENGAITANKIAANSITADKIVAGSVEAVHIAADAITTDKLAANAITAKHTITGALIQTTATVNRGLKITSTGMQGFDNIGNQTLSYTSATGAVTIRGRFQTSVSNVNSVILDSNLYAGRPAIQLHTGNAAQVQPVMYSMGSGSSDYPAGALLIHGRETTTNSSGRNTLQLNAGNGSGASLQQEYGSFSAMGFSYSGWVMVINGRKSTGHGALAYQIYQQTSTFSGSPESVSQGLSYGQAAPNGTRMVHLSGVSNTSGNPTIAACATSPSLSGVRIVGSNVTTTHTYRVNLLVMWAQGGTN